MQPFQCVTITPIHLRGARTAIATAEAGGIGILDLENCPPASMKDAVRNLNRLVAAKGEIGIRVTGPTELLELFGDRPHWVVGKAPAAPGRKFLAEISRAEDLDG